MVLSKYYFCEVHSEKENIILYANSRIYGFGFCAAPTGCAGMGARMGTAANAKSRTTANGAASHDATPHGAMGKSRPGRKSMDET